MVPNPEGEVDTFDKMTPKARTSEDLCPSFSLRIAKWLALRPDECAPEWKVKGEWKTDVSSSVGEGIQGQCFCEALVGFGFLLSGFSRYII